MQLVFLKKICQKNIFLNLFLSKFPFDQQILKNHTYSSADDSDCYVYSLIVNAWTKGKKKFFTASNKSVSNFQSIGKNGKLMYLSEERQGSSNDDAEIR